jgi:hypothetical protein
MHRLAQHPVATAPPSWSLSTITRMQGRVHLWIERKRVCDGGRIRAIIATAARANAHSQVLLVVRFFIRFFGICFRLGRAIGQQTKEEQLWQREWQLASVADSKREQCTKEAVPRSETFP